jgi:tRNA threonylcarbamoyladenosine biosynthesis protein TsaE
VKTKISNLDELREFATELAQDSCRPLLILLDGPMGAGKTQFASYFVEARGGEAAASPSYAFHHVYQASGEVIDHFDLFRLETLDDLESIGFWDVLTHAQTVLIEWADKLDEFSIPKDWSRSFTQISLRFSVDEFSLSRVLEKT